MNANAIVRNMSIDLLLDIDNPVISWFNELWDNIICVETDIHHTNGGELIYYTTSGIDNKIIFYQDNSYNVFWCHHTNFWSGMSHVTNCQDPEVQVITKFLVENKLNKSIKPPAYGVRDYCPIVNAALCRFLAKF